MATDRQKEAIKNLLSYLRTNCKHNHGCLTKEELKTIDNMSFNTASRQIDKLIRYVEDYDNDLMGTYGDIMGMGS